jgi:hypothetical protein
MLKLYAQVPQGRQESVHQAPHNLKMMMQSQVEHKPQNSFLHTCGSQWFR